MNAISIDVAVLGAGGAGYPGAFLLAKSGRSVMMVDPIGNFGGDCLAEGCVPSKIPVRRYLGKRTDSSN